MVILRGPGESQVYLTECLDNGCDQPVREREIEMKNDKAENSAASHGSPQVCNCGNKAIGWLCRGEENVAYCSECDPDPDVDLSDTCYSCGKPSHRSEHIGSGIDLGVCEECDTGEHLGYEHLGG